MRTIKFRGWDKKRKGMIFGLNPFVVIHDENYAVMQYTGLKDKNGKDVYEGDIVLVLDRDWPSGDYSNQTPQEYMRSIASTCKVVWDKGSFWLEQVKGKGHYYPDFREHRRDIFEVIGNIWENPDLT